MTEKNEIVRKTDQPAALMPAGMNPAWEILRLSIDKGATVEQLAGILDLQERVDVRLARREYRHAFALFQAECPPIPQDATVDFLTKAGRRTHYSHSSLGQIAKIVNPILGRLGLSYSWESSVVEGQMIVTCIVEHEAGHRETAKFGLPAEGGTDTMSMAQRYASTLTYARRQSLVQALGLTTESDPDGADMDAPGSSREITAEQAANVEALLTEVKGDRAGFLRYMEVGAISEILASDLSKAIAALEAKRRKA